MMKCYRVTDKEFSAFGRVLHVDAAELISAANAIPLPKEGSSYEASVDVFEKLGIAKYFQDEIYGELPIQMGYCWGHSQKLNALEWHKCSEVNVAVTDMVLFLGLLPDLENNRYDSAKIKAFYVKKGEVIEVYATTMHFCPCEVSPYGFGCVVVLPAGTNTPLDKPAKDKLLFRKNKWIIAHEDNRALLDRGVAGGVYGKNFDVSEVLSK